MPAIDRELRVIDGFLRDLESRGTRPQKSAATSPIELRFCFARTSDEIRQIEAEQVVTFDHIRIPFLDETRQALERISLRFLDVFLIDNYQFFPARVVRERDAHEVIG